MSNKSTLLKHLFGEPVIEQVKEEQLADLIKKYPYFAHAHWFKALKSGKKNASPDLSLAGAFAMWPLRLIQFLNNTAPFQENNDVKTVVPESNTTPPTTLVSSPTENKENEEDADKEENEEDSASKPENLSADNNSLPSPLIQPLYTSDYFAYTGAKLPDNMEDDKRPTMDQLHSFTGWLRTLKKSQGTPDPDLQSDEASMAARWENENATVWKNAAESVTASEEVFTEAMAEVRVSKGQMDRAIAIYEKLSLSNPEKSAYFAKKIADLKK